MAEVAGQGEEGRGGRCEALKRRRRRRRRRKVISLGILRCPVFVSVLRAAAVLVDDVLIGMMVVFVVCVSHFQSVILF